VLLCGAGAVLAVIIAWPMVSVLALYAARYSVRAQDVTVDSSLLVVGVGLAVAASILLAFVPRLPSAESATGLGLSTGSVRITSGTNRRLRVFAITQIAASFVLLAGAGALITTLLALQRERTGLRGSVLAVNVPVVSYTRKPEEITGFYREAIRRIAALPGVEQVALGTVVPWRDPGFFAAQFMAEGYRKANGEEDPRANFRTVSPGFFSALGVRLIAGRDFNEGDRHDGEKVVVVSQSLAQRMFPNMDALNHHLMWTDPVTKFIGVSTGSRRIIGIVPDIDDEHLVATAQMTIYHPMEQEMNGGRLFVHTKMDPYGLVPTITKIVRDLAPDQPVERAATLDDVRAEVLSPNRVNAMVFSGFAGVALAIAIVGVAGVLAFSVSARTREFGIRLAIGSTPGALLTRIVREGAVIGLVGIVAGAIGGVLLARVVNHYIIEVEIPGTVPIIASAFVLVAAAVLASVMPGARASRVDVISALRAD
jgi:predicted permease